MPLQHCETVFFTGMTQHENHSVQSTKDTVPCSYCLEPKWSGIRMLADGTDLTFGNLGANFSVDQET
jgi:hypothetical protein